MDSRNKKFSYRRKSQQTYKLRRVCQPNAGGGIGIGTGTVPKKLSYRAALSGTNASLLYGGGASGSGTVRGHMSTLLRSTSVRTGTDTGTGVGFTSLRGAAGGTERKTNACNPEETIAIPPTPIPIPKHPSTLDDILEDYIRFVLSAFPPTSPIWVSY